MRLSSRSLAHQSTANGIVRLRISPPASSPNKILPSNTTPTSDRDDRASEWDQRVGPRQMGSDSNNSQEYPRFLDDDPPFSIAPRSTALRYEGRTLTDSYLLLCKSLKLQPQPQSHPTLATGTYLQDVPGARQPKAFPGKSGRPQDRSQAQVRWPRVRRLCSEL